MQSCLYYLLILRLYIGWGDADEGILIDEFSDDSGVLIKTECTVYLEDVNQDGGVLTGFVIEFHDL
jgi:hypothetical protein